MDKMTKILIFTAASHMLLSMLATIVQSRKRKRRVVREPITYGPIAERDRTRIDYLNDKIWKNDTTSINMLRLSKARFFRFCKIFRDRALLEDTLHVSIEEQVGMFLNTVGHNL